MTNRDHSPSIAQNGGGDAKLRTEGSGLDLDALEAVARAATPGPWDDDQSGFDCTWSVISNGWPVAYVSAEDRNGISEEADATFIATFDPPTVLRLIQTQRELVAALEALSALFDDYRESDLSHADAHNILVRYPVWQAARAALLKALSHQPPRAPDEPGDRAREETKS